MNNNFNNEKQNNKNNNESLLDINDYPNYSNSNKHNQKLVRICKYCSISYIVLFLISIAFMVVALSIYLYYLYGGDQVRFIVGYSWQLGDTPLFGIMLLVVTPTVACILLILNIVLIITTIYLYKCHLYDDRSLLVNVWFVVGIFLVVPSFVGCILSISNCNKIKKLYFNNTVTVKKSWKVFVKTFVAFGSIASIIGAGLTGGTYKSYNNYMLLKGMENVVEVRSLGYNLSYYKVQYLHTLVGDYDYGRIIYKAFGEYTNDDYQTVDIDNLTDFFNCYSNIIEWLSNTQNNEGIIDYLSSMNKSSLSSNDSDLVSQTINDFNNLKSSLSNGFPNASTIENILSNITASKNDNAAYDLEKALNPYNGSSGLLTIISSIDSDLTQLINDKVIDLSSTSSMNSTTKQYFENYISLLGTNSANLIDVNQSGFVAMFDTTSAISVFNNTNAIGLNDLSLYLLDSNSLWSTYPAVTAANYFEVLSTLYQFPSNSNQEVYRFVFSQISPEGWNREITHLTSHGKTHMNQFFQNQLNAFYDLYPTEDSYEQAMSGTNLSDYAATIYYLQDFVYYLDCNYDANQDGVIAGSVLLSIGLVALIISTTSLGIIRRKEKKETK